MKLTVWYPSSINPVRVGVYEVRIPKGVHMWSLWTGRRWNTLVFNMDYAAKETRISHIMYHQPMQWRGVGCANE
jgi:hypothetical protein